VDATAFRRYLADPEGQVGPPDLLLFMAECHFGRETWPRKINEFGLGQGKIPTVSFSITIAEPDMLQSVGPEVVQGIMTIVANWGSKGHEDLISELKAKYKEPWMTQNVISNLRRYVADEGGAGTGRQSRSP